MRIMKISIISILSAILVVFAGCEEDYLETQPTDQLSDQVIFQTYKGALTALDGTYRLMYNFQDEHNEFSEKSIDLNVDLKGEDMVVASEGYGWFLDQYDYTDRTPSQEFNEYIWDYYYNLVNNANRIIANIDDIKASDEEYNYVKGQALAIRAFAYFNLVRLYQHPYPNNANEPGVPLYTEPTTEGNPRASVEEVYTAIEDDLGNAIDLLNPENCLTRSEAGRNKSHINQAVAQGIMARVKLTKEEWSDAADYADKAVQDYELYQPSEYTAAGFNSVDGKEWMWGMQINGEHQTTYASFFSHMDATFTTYASLGLQKLITESLYNQIPDDDVRKDLWLESQQSPNLPQYNQMKFLSYAPSEFLGDYLFMRASEMYLIQAEALANAGNDTEAQNKLETLISNRQPGYTTSATGQDLLEEIYLQRRIELWGEGFRLYDLKRRNQPLDRTGTNHNPALAREMDLEANADLMIYQIPQEEIDANDALERGDQNP